MPNKITVAILGATGAVGQRFVRLLVDHPFFEVTALAASERSAGQRYKDACRWVIPGDPPPSISEMIVSPLEAKLAAKLVFSALPAKVAHEVEPRFAAAGYAVCSNASALRYEKDVPLVIPEVNPDHLTLIERQRKDRDWPGFIVTNPNCSTTGIAMVLKPLHDAFELKKAFITTMQAVSGAGYPGVPSLDILGNILPYIGGEEEKIERETRLLLGRVVDGERIEAEFVVSAQANRVPVTDGHTICLSLGFKESPSVEETIAVLSEFQGLKQVRELPSAPDHPLRVNIEPDRPQPRRDRDVGQGMTVSVGRVRPCLLLDLRMVLVVHNTLRGAAAGSILNAELLASEGYLG